MKKLLLSSIVMLGICSFATAQNAQSTKQAKFGKTQTAASATSPSFTTASGASATVPAEKVAAADADQGTTISVPVAVEAKAAANPAAVVNADGTVSELSPAKQMEIKKAAAAKKKDN